MHGWMNCFAVLIRFIYYYSLHDLFRLLMLNGNALLTFRVCVCDIGQSNTCGFMNDFYNPVIILEIASISAVYIVIKLTLKSN